MKKVIGLTGGIASGKSTVVAFLRSKGYKVIDADKLVHQLQSPGGELYDAILNHYGSDFFDENGMLNRTKLGALVFSSEQSRATLAALQNEIIREELYSCREKEWAGLKENSPEESILFMDIPLLFEQKYDGFDEVWLVSLPENIQMERLISRNHLSEKEAKQRIASQMSLEEKAKRADRILDNSGTVKDLETQVEQFLDKLRNSLG